MKIAPLMAAFRKEPRLDALLVHTGQHYDAAMCEQFFRQLAIPEPDINLNCGGGSHAQQTAAIMSAFEPVVLGQQPDAVLVVGDVNSTVACGLTAVKLGVPVIHVEAGLRSGDRSMPEEINRIITDAISDLLFCSEPSGAANLAREGVDAARIHLVGNVMIDTLMRHRERAAGSSILAELGLQPRTYGLLTLHRPSNVDDEFALASLIGLLRELARDLPIVFPVHPRTRQRMQAFGLLNESKGSGLRVIDPLGYLEFMKLMMDAAVVLTDSGGVQEETTVLGVPCLTLRENTERPVTVEQGTNRLVGVDPGAIRDAFHVVLAAPPFARMPAMWDGRAAERITAVVLGRFP